MPYMLGLVEGHDVASLDTVDRVHLGCEAKRLAFADRDAVNTDPEQLPVDVRTLLQPGYLARRREAIVMDRAMPDPAPGALAGDTTYFCVVDAERNCLSVIQSLYHGFGSCFVAGSTGLFLQNRGAYFSLDPSHVNVLQPRKRTAHTLMSAMVLRDGRPVIVPGTMGGDGQPQIQFQLLTAMIDRGLNPQQAIELPRWVHGPGTGGPTLFLENRFEPEVVEALQARGHRVGMLTDWSGTCGHAQVIAIDEHGLAGGADPRGDGQAGGY
jgi:gamma-glutamyltranspeptidase/glutathione hydrolase